LRILPLWAGKAAQTGRAQQKQRLNRASSKTAPKQRKRSRRHYFIKSGGIEFRLDSIFDLPASSVFADART
jgi:hypothetical protein